MSLQKLKVAFLGPLASFSHQVCNFYIGTSKYFWLSTPALHLISPRLSILALIFMLNPYMLLILYMRSCRC